MALVPGVRARILGHLPHLASFMATSNPTGPLLSSRSTISYFPGTCIYRAPAVCLALSTPLEQCSLPKGPALPCTAPPQTTGSELDRHPPWPRLLLGGRAPSGPALPPTGPELSRGPGNAERGVGRGGPLRKEQPAWHARQTCCFGGNSITQWHLFTETNNSTAPSLCARSQGGRGRGGEGGRSASGGRRRGDSRGRGSGQLGTAE